MNSVPAASKVFTAGCLAVLPKPWLAVSSQISSLVLSILSRGPLIINITQRYDAFGFVLPNHSSASDTGAAGIARAFLIRRVSGRLGCPKARLQADR